MKKASSIIVGILGSGSEESLCRQGVMTVAEQVRAKGMQFDLIDLKHQFRELHDPSVYSNPPVDSQTADLRRRINGAAGIVLATPVYHGSFSGLLKNALDHLAPGAFKHRAVGLLSAGGAMSSTSLACEPLRTVVRALGGWSTPTHVGLTSGELGPDGPNENLKKRIAAMVAELEYFTEMHVAYSSDENSVIEVG